MLNFSKKEWELIFIGSIISTFLPELFPILLPKIVAELNYWIGLIIENIARLFLIVLFFYLFLKGPTRS